MSPGGSGYFTCIQIMKLITNNFKSGGLHEKHVVATWNVGNRRSICLETQGNQEKPVSRWPVAGVRRLSKIKTTTNTHKITTHIQDNYNNTRGQPTTITHNTT